MVTFLYSSIKNEPETREAAALLDQYLGNHDKRNMVIDLSRVKFMTSSMIGELVKLRKKCDRRKVKLRLCGLSGDLEEIFRIAKMHKFFEIYPNQEKAIK